MTRKQETEKKKYLFTDDFTFSLVMRDEAICRGMLERIIPDAQFDDIRFEIEANPLFSDEELTVGAQQSFNFDTDAHGVRFDAYAKSSKLWAEIEMQTYTGEHVGKRSRYYQANMDIDALEKGRKYRELKPTYVIFICTFDYPGAGKPVYFFQHYDVKNDLCLNDEAYIIILNTKCNPDLVPDRLKPLFAYINDPTRIEDEFIQQIEERVLRFNTQEWRRKQVTLEHLLDNEREKGEERLNKLYELLFAQNRVEDVKRATTDSEYRQKLYEEFGLNQ